MNRTLSDPAVVEQEKMAGRIHQFSCSDHVACSTVALGPQLDHHDRRGEEDMPQPGTNRPP